MPAIPSMASENKGETRLNFASDLGATVRLDRLARDLYVFVTVF
jgi:hypothetical protein